MVVKPIPRYMELNMTRRKAQVLALSGDGEPENLNVFFIRLRERRVSMGLSQTQLGERIGASVHVMSQLERGAFPRDPARVKAIADALGVSLDWLFGRE